MCTPLVNRRRSKPLSTAASNPLPKTGATNQICVLAPQRTSEIVGAMAKLSRGFDDTQPGFLREARHLGDVVENHRDRRSRETDVFGQLSQSDSVA
jgi:hypothetical protein